MRLWRARQLPPGYGKRRRRAENGADIVRIRNLIEHEHDRIWIELVDIERRQGVGFSEQTLVDGFRTQARYDCFGTHQFQVGRDLNSVLAETSRCVLRGEQAVQFAGWVLDSGLHAMPTIKNHRSVAVARRRAMPALRLIRARRARTMPC
jgi:hypothetical protein